ncbi:MAG TPA: hypothetical protein VIO38_13040, partial [Rariglobus sp.]
MIASAIKIGSRHFLGEGTSIAYPHCNGFVPGGEKLVVGRRLGETDRRLVCVDLRTLREETLPPIPHDGDPTDKPGISHDIALLRPRIAALSRRAAWTLDLEPGARWRKVYAPAQGSKLQDLPSISPDGARLLVGETRPHCHAAVEIDLETLQPRTLFTLPWYANHFHYCPHDPSWIGFSHEGPTEATLDRCWVWHEQRARVGRCVFDQFTAADDPSRPLNVGHERWAFHDTSAYVVAYAVSPGGPRGLYEVFADGRPPRLLRQTNTAWHCNMDASGRIAVIDTSAPWDPVPATGAAYEAGVAAHLKADREKTPNLSDVVLLDLATGEDLHIARVTRTRHPWHPHPALSPDARWLAYTDDTPGRQGSWLVQISAD